MPPDALPADRRPAARTRLAFSVPNFHVVPHFFVDRCARFFDAPDAPRNHLMNRTVKIANFFWGESGYKGLWMKPGREEYLVGIRVADRAEGSVVIDEDAHLFAIVRRCYCAKSCLGKRGRKNVDSLCCVFRNCTNLFLLCTVHLGHLLHRTD